MPQSDTHLQETLILQRVALLAQERNLPVEEMLEKAVREYLDAEERQAIRDETKAFWAMHDELVEKYCDRHVAIYHGEVVDYDEDASRLEKRVRERFGWLPVLIAPVRRSPRRDLRWMGGRGVLNTLLDGPAMTSQLA